MKIQNLLEKFWIHRKIPVQSEQNLANCETKFPFLNDFQILHAGSNSIEEL